MLPPLRLSAWLLPETEELPLTERLPLTVSGPLTVMLPLVVLCAFSVVVPVPPSAPEQVSLPILLMFGACRVRVPAASTVAFPLALIAAFPPISTVQSLGETVRKEPSFSI